MNKEETSNKQEIMKKKEIVNKYFLEELRVVQRIIDFYLITMKIYWVCFYIKPSMVKSVLVLVDCHFITLGFAMQKYI